MTQSLDDIFDDLINEKVSSAIADHDFSDAIEDYIDNQVDFDEKVQSAIDEFDFSEIIENGIENVDLESVVRRTLKNTGVMSGLIEDAVSEMFEDIQRKVVGEVAAKVERDYCRIIERIEALETAKGVAAPLDQSIEERLAKLEAKEHKLENLEKLDAIVTFIKQLFK